MRPSHGQMTAFSLAALVLAGMAAVFAPSCGSGGGGGGGGGGAAQPPTDPGAVDPAPAPVPAPSSSAAVVVEVTATGVKGRVTAGSATAQSLTGPAGSPVAGVTLTIPAGALAADVEIAIDAATGSAAGRLAEGYGLDGVAAAVGAAVQLTATPPIAPSAAMTLTLRGASGATLTEPVPVAAVLYDAAPPASGSSVLQAPLVTVQDPNVLVQAANFGRYQAILFEADATPATRRLAVRGTSVLSPPLVGTGAHLRANSPVLSPARPAGTSKLEHEGVGP